ncbi:MAG TPA: glycosyltransferase, partial [Candidatus Paceibacterota bacterium]|nr:glycosyltransferase [Candidatus Paceibacterota bacterium]
GAMAIFAFDTSIVGTSAAFVGMIRRIPVVIRVGGDFVWESYIERTKDLVPLTMFYTSPTHLNLKEQFARRLVGWTLRHSFPAFNTGWLLDIWREPYKIDKKRARVVSNVIPARAAQTETHNRSVLMYGRQIALKNTDAFRKAFQQASVDLELERGIIPFAELMEQMRTCYAVAVPSISEVAPNTIIEAITHGKPFLLSKYSGFAEKYKDFGIIIDPLDEADMQRGIREIADPDVYKRLCERIETFKEVRTYKDVADEFLDIIQV